MIAYDLGEIEGVIADSVEDQVLKLVHGDQEVIAQRRHFLAGREADIDRGQGQQLKKGVKREDIGRVRLPSTLQTKISLSLLSLSLGHGIGLGPTLVYGRFSRHVTADYVRIHDVGGALTFHGSDPRRKANRGY